MIGNVRIRFFGMALCLVAFCSSCERSEQQSKGHAKGDDENGDVLEKSVDAPLAMLEIFHEDGRPVLLEPLPLLGACISPDKKLKLILHQDHSPKIQKATSAESALNSLLTIKVNGIFIDDQRNANGWVGGVLATGSVAEDVLSDLRSEGLKIVEIEHGMFMPDEHYLDALNAE